MLVALVLGSLVIVPSASYVSTNVRARNMLEENVKGLYAAESGVEYAMWWLLNGWGGSDNQDAFPAGPVTLPYLINGMTVAYKVEFVPSLAGVSFDQPHLDWLQFSQDSSYDESTGIYSYTLTMTEAKKPQKAVKLDWIQLNMPEGFEYVLNSANITSASENKTIEPQISGGGADQRLTLGWPELPIDPKKNYPDIMTLGDKDPPANYYLNLQLTGPPGLHPAPAKGTFGMIGIQSQDIGVVTTAWPFRIEAWATNSRGEQARVRAGAWYENGSITLRTWLITP